MNQITNFKTLIGTLYKKLQNASITGKLNVRELYLINIINNLLLECPTCLDFKYRQKLQNLTIELQHIDEDICIYREIRSLYNNIVGCKNCNDMNNSNIKVINTPPVIEDPIIIEPDPVEVITGCDGTAGLFPFFDYLEMEYGSFTKCYEPTSLVFESIKILSLPTKGVLQYNGVNLEINTTINFTDIANLTYTPIVERGLFLEDTFTYTMMTDEVIPRITEVSTITIIIR